MEIVCTLKAYREFESLPLRQQESKPVEKSTGFFFLGRDRPWACSTAGSLGSPPALPAERRGERAAWTFQTEKLWSILPVIKVKCEAAAQRRPAETKRENRVFPAKRQAVWFETQSFSNWNCSTCQVRRSRRYWLSHSIKANSDGRTTAKQHDHGHGSRYPLHDGGKTGEAETSEHIDKNALSFGQAPSFFACRHHCI